MGPASEAFDFFVGVPEMCWAPHFARTFISISRLRRRKASFAPSPMGWGMDSAGFSEVAINGGYAQPPEQFAAEACAWTARVPGCIFVSSQDYMCEELALQSTGGTVDSHQRMTIERYDAIKAAWTSESALMPVLQGFHLREYLKHIEDYGDRLTEGMIVGVGSVCKRNKNVSEIEDILGEIHHRRPDLELHGFGVKTTALQSPLVRKVLRRADSMAGAFHARRQANVLLTALRKEMGNHIKPKEARAIYRERGVHMPDPNDWRETMKFAQKVATAAQTERPDQLGLWGWS